jgi:hypothetical protein
MHDLNKIRSALLDPNNGFYILKGFYSESEADAYRKECARFLGQGKIIYQRINTDYMADYVHPRSHDQELRTERIYQYFHNHTDDAVGRFLTRAVDLRNQIEEAWLADPIYREEKETLQSYVIATHYLPDTGMLHKHRDYSGPAPYPLVQFWVLLSHPEIDYKRGNLVVYSKSGRRYRVEGDLGAKKGDVLIFDKSLFHEVEVNEPSGISTGRWTV